MPSLNFLKRFESKLPFVKKHTIRRKRKRLIRRNDLLFLFIGLRTKYCRKLYTGHCIDVKDIIIKIKDHKLIIIIDKKQIAEHEKTRLALNDGFDTYEEFLIFFMQSGLPFKGQIIAWIERINYETI